MAVYFGEDKVNLLGGITVSLNGTDTSDATATSEDIVYNKTAYVNGEKVTGTLAKLTSTSFNDISPTLDENYGIKLSTKFKNRYLVTTNTTISMCAKTSEFGDATASDVAAGKTFTSAAGLLVTGTRADSSNDTTVETVEQATPTISVSTSGLITASATQTAGYVEAGTKSATKQLTTQAAKTYTPGTSSQTIASGTYLTGTQTIQGDSNLVASNIKSGVSIFGVSGSYTGESSGETTSGGLAMKTGTTSEATFDTGLSSVKQFVLYKTAVAATGLVQATYNEGLGTSYVYCSSYSTWSKSYAIGTTAPTIDGGSVTWNGSSTQRLSSSTEYTWIAIGEE